VLLGVPGSSNAFYIAARLGLPQEIVDEARAFLSRQEIETGELLQQIEASRKAASEAEMVARREKEEALRLREEYDTRVAQIANVQRTVKQQAQEEARQILRKAEDRAENIVKELQRMNKGARKGSSARQRLNSLRSETYDSLRPDEMPEEELTPIDPGHVYKAGDRVRVISLNMDGEVLEAPKDGVVAVQMGAMRAKFPIAQLRPSKTVPAPEKVKASSSGVGAIAMQKALHISPELMLMAMRADEAQSLLEKYVDDAYAAGLREARIIHGKGSGVLRRVVHEFLRGNPAVSSFRLGDESEGGDGATVVTFKA
jgi:DNA mismatch repair protein MutS2